jgi:outer membrane murein-binding lipoprotein Lpp
MWNPFRRRRPRATDLILERFDNISTDITDLKTSVAALQSDFVTAIQPVLQANADLNTKMLAKFDEFLAALGDTVTQHDIDELTATVQTTCSSLHGQAQNVAAQNAALQAELDKAAAATQPMTTPTTPTPAPSA